MTPRRLVFTILIALLALPAAAGAADQRSENMSLVKNLPFKAQEKYGQDVPYGTDIEFGKFGSKRYAFAGSELNGLQIADITKPRSTKIVKVFDCAVSQGDPQVFKRGKRTYVAYTNDYETTEETASSLCFRQAEKLGLDAIDDDGKSRLGTMIIDVTKPTKPVTASFVAIPRGSHNMTVHPSGRYLYNSNSDLTGTGPLATDDPADVLPSIEVYDITTLRKPKLAKKLDLTPLPGLGTDSHDITFNDKGTRAYSAALSHGVIIDTSNPANPTVISEFDDEAINVWHQSDPYTVRDRRGRVIREFLIVEDELAGAAGPGICPSGGVHIFDVSNEAIPVKVGYWNIDDVAAKGPTDTCTAHVFDIHEDEGVMTIAYYMGGVRVVDISGLAKASIGVGAGDQGVGGFMREVGHYVPENANTWAAKTPFIEKDGDFFLYGNDINRGLDVYRYEAEDAPSENDGSFKTPAVAGRQIAKAPAGLLDLSKKQDRQQARKVGGFCLLPRRAR
jgi:hypothetical protein